MNSESQQYVSARRSSQTRVTPLSRTATRQWLTAVTPKGQGDKWSSAALLVLEAGCLLRRTSVLHLTTSRLAASTNISW